jgi:hypothetical protein
MNRTILAAVVVIVSTNAIFAAIPTLDELAGDWMQVNTLRSFPAVHNFAGGLKIERNLTVFQNLMIPPYGQRGLMAELQLDGASVNAVESRWYPFEIRRRATVNEVAMESSIRMPFEQNGVLTRITFKNTSQQPRTLNLGLNLSGRVRIFTPEKWAIWETPRPADANFMATASEGGKLVTIVDKESPAVTIYAFVQAPNEMKAEGEKGSVKWSMTLAPGQSSVIEYAIGIGSEAASVTKMTEQWASKFNSEFDAAKAKWEERWQAAFVPGNRHFSGHFPTLVTDDANIRRVYYHGALVPLLSLRTTFPVSPRFFVTDSPDDGSSLYFYWCMDMWPNAWAMLEPVTMKEMLLKVAAIDHHLVNGQFMTGSFAIDGISGKGSGRWYAANDWSLFRTIEAYIGVTGDTAFLKQEVNGKTILQRLDDMATYYATRPLTKDTPLANWGVAIDTLECSPSYMEGVASFNGVNVYMLNKMAELHEKSGNAERGAELRAKAKRLLAAVLDLYEHGQGVWSAMNKDGKKVPIRHCFDYLMIAQGLENDLTPQMKSEMNTFVERELLTKTWMRAMSLQDPVAEHSDRPDHGPMGSYDAWPALVMDGMCRLGAFDQATAFLRSVEPITREGPFAQAHEFVGPDKRGKDPIVRSSMTPNDGCGAAFAEVIIRAFFGVRPDLSGESLSLLAPTVPRGFNGELRHVPFRGALYTVKSDAQGVRQNRE